MGATMDRLAWAVRLARLALALSVLAFADKLSRVVFAALSPTLPVDRDDAALSLVTLVLVACTVAAAVVVRQGRDAQYAGVLPRAEESLASRRRRI